MPKIRGIKPDLWTDENFVELSPYARLLWIGLWNHACDNGHLQDKSKQIKMRILPTDDVNCAELLREIETQGLIERDDGWITIPNLPDHQKPHKHWYVICDKPGCVHPSGMTYGIGKTACLKPDCRHGSTVDQPLSNGGTPVEQPVNNGGSTADGDVDGDGDGELMVTTTSSAADASAPKKTERATQRPSDFRPTESHVSLAEELGVDLRAEWQQFCDHHDAKGSTYKDWNAALRTWIRNATKYGGRRQSASQPNNVQQHLALARKLAEDEQGQMIPFPQIGGGGR